MAKWVILFIIIYTDKGVHKETQAHKIEFIIKDGTRGFQTFSFVTPSQKRSWEALCHVSDIYVFFHGGVHHQLSQQAIPGSMPVYVSPWKRNVFNNKTARLLLMSRHGKRQTIQLYRIGAPESLNSSLHKTTFPLTNVILIHNRTQSRKTEDNSHTWCVVLGTVLRNLASPPMSKSIQLLFIHASSNIRLLRWK